VRDQLSGVLAVRGTLPPDSLPQVTGRIDLDAGPFHRGRLDTLHAEFGVSGQLVKVDALARTGEGSITLAGQAEVDTSWTVGRATLDGRFDLPDLGRLIADSGEAGASGQIHLAGQGTQVETMRWETNANVSGRWGAARLDSMLIDARIADARLTLDTLVVRSNLLDGGGAGQTSLRDSPAGAGDTIRIRLVADTAAPVTLGGMFGIDPLSTRMGEIDIRAWHAEQKVRVSGRVSLGGLIAGIGGADSLDLTGGAAWSRAGISDVNGTLTALRVAYNRVELERLEATLESDSNRFGFTVTARRDNNHTATLAGSGVVGERKIFFSGLGFAFGDTEWALTDSAAVTWGDRVVISDFDLRHGDRRISIEGHLDRDGTQDLAIQLDSVPLLSFAEFADFEGLDAVLNGTVKIDGPAHRSGPPHQPDACDDNAYCAAGDPAGRRAARREPGVDAIRGRKIHGAGDGAEPALAFARAAHTGPGTRGRVAHHPVRRLPYRMDDALAPDLWRKAARRQTPCRRAHRGHGSQP
jgi:hypothetical protein